MITQAFATFLLSATAITTLAQEIRPQKLLEGHGDPALVYTLANDRAIRTFDGLSSLAQATFEIDIYSANYADAKALAGAVRSTLDNYSGLLDAGYRADQVDFIGEADMFEAETMLNHISLTISIWYTAL